VRPAQENASDVPNQRLIKAATAFARVVIDVACSEQRVNGVVADGRSVEPAGGGSVQVPPAAEGRRSDSGPLAIWTMSRSQIKTADYKTMSVFRVPIGRLPFITMMLSEGTAGPASAARAGSAAPCKRAVLAMRRHPDRDAAPKSEACLCSMCGTDYSNHDMSGRGDTTSVRRTIPWQMQSFVRRPAC
jgi:hypothetical protein